jgi:hypothetical protein
MDDLKAFRQVDSLTPGHPEANHTDGMCVSRGFIANVTDGYRHAGIEVTTGPLGQGFGNGVGLAIAQAHLGAIYNKEGFDLINNYTYGMLKFSSIKLLIRLLNLFFLLQCFVETDVSWRAFPVKLPVSQVIFS